MHEVECALCGAGGAVAWYAGRDTNYGVPGVFRLVRCVACGHVFMNPRPAPESIPALYPEHYGPHATTAPPADDPGAPRGDTWKDRIKRDLSVWRYHGRPAVGGAVRQLLLLPFVWYARLLRLILLPPRRAGAKVLDVGCGAGDFLLARKREGWQVFGVEPSARAAALARRRTGAEIVDGTLLEAAFPSNTFQLLTLWHVLEHVGEPLDLLREAYRVLQPGGHVLVMVPNVRSLELTIFGGDWLNLDLPRHLHHFAAPTLVRVLRDAGFDVLRVSHQIEGATIFASLRNRYGLPRRPPYRGVWRVLKAPCWVLSFILAQVNTSGIVCAYARRPGPE